jgi:hypothetical protein
MIFIILMPMIWISLENIQNLNRTANFYRKEKVSRAITYLISNQSENQTAVKELSGKLDWRQIFFSQSKSRF